VTERQGEHRGRLLVDALVSHPYVVAVGFLLAAAASAVTVFQFVSGDDAPASPSASESPQVAPTSDLVTTAEPADPQVSQYVVPLSAPMAEFPWDFGCTDENRAWLAEHGQERQRDWLLSIRSASDGGANMLAVTDIRLDGTVDTADPPEPVFVFDCPGAGAADFVSGSLAIGEGAVARDRATDQPVALNLAPGEVVQLQLFFAGTAGTDGAVVADVSSGSETHQETLIPADELTLTSLGRYADVVVTIGGEPGHFTCATADFSVAEDCTAETLPAFVAAHT
jgi:hypothetical protein